MKIVNIVKENKKVKINKIFNKNKEKNKNY